jgi:hypothetical protein
MKINRTGIDSQQISNTTEASAKQEVKKAPVSSDVQSRWDNFVSEQSTQGGAMDPNALVQYVLRESYMQTTEDLRFYAEKVKYFNETKKEIRDYMSKMRDYEKNIKPDVDSLKIGKAIDNNVIDRLATVIKESINDSNEGKKYFLQKLENMNKTATDLAQNMEAIVKASQDLAAKEKKDDDDD